MNLLEIVKNVKSRVSHCTKIYSSLCVHACVRAATSVTARFPTAQSGLSINPARYCNSSNCPAGGSARSPSTIQGRRSHDEGCSDGSFFLERSRAAAGLSTHARGFSLKLN